MLEQGTDWFKTKKSIYCWWQCNILISARNVVFIKKYNTTYMAKLKQNVLKTGMYMMMMILFLIISLFTNDVFISHLYASVSIIIGALATHNVSTQKKYEQNKNDNTY